MVEPETDKEIEENEYQREVEMYSDLGRCAVTGY
jgi:hypothetical protein